ncbi:GTPase imap family member 7-like [Gigaspora margarita]|uniref:GTPase imap family member 7-like n=1 Tax=Gigaspora margarita TaxID=4874 RepID=A0A8H4ADP4_GIGMA|nr:GTPase imap family member 7-like [Gigaspora margarita]
MYIAKEPDIIKCSESLFYDEKASATPATNIKNIRYPTNFAPDETGVRKSTHGNSLFGFNEDIGQQVAYQKQKTTDNCFKPDTKVILEIGKVVPMSSIKVGDRICVGANHGELEFSEVYLNVHCDLEAETEYQRIEFTMPTTGLTESILLTHDHHILINNNYFDYAKNVQPYSTKLHVLSGKQIIPVRVANVSTEIHKGYIALLTRTGTILADNVMCSCYSTCAPFQDTIHTILAPLRFTTWFKKSTHTGEEIHPYLGFLYNRYKDVNNAYDGLGKIKSRILNR